jgi:hypothetical protein
LLFDSKLNYILIDKYCHAKMYQIGDQIKALCKIQKLDDILDLQKMVFINEENLLARDIPDSPVKKQ